MAHRTTSRKDYLVPNFSLTLSFLAQRLIWRNSRKETMVDLAQRSFFESLRLTLSSTWWTSGLEATVNLPQNTILCKTWFKENIVLPLISTCHTGKFGINDYLLQESTRRKSLYGERVDQAYETIRCEHQAGTMLNRYYGRFGASADFMKVPLLR